jgi:hypothetical protein
MFLQTIVGWWWWNWCADSHPIVTLIAIPDLWCRFPTTKCAPPVNLYIEQSINTHQILVNLTWCGIHCLEDRSIGVNTLPEGEEDLASRSSQVSVLIVSSFWSGEGALMMRTKDDYPLWHNPIRHSVTDSRFVNNDDFSTYATWQKRNLCAFLHPGLHGVTPSNYGLLPQDTSLREYVGPCWLDAVAYTVV